MKRNKLTFVALIFLSFITCVFSEEHIPSKEIAMKKHEKDILNIHPWGIYLLYGNIADLKNIIVAINLKALEKSNEIANLKLISNGNWRGFATEGFKFQYKVYKQLSSKCYVLQCAYLPYASGSFGCYLVVKKEERILYNDGKKETIVVLFTKGVFYNKPSDKDLKNIQSELKIEPPCKGEVFLTKNGTRSKKCLKMPLRVDNNDFNYVRYKT
jgi:hypothetical protein